MLIVFTLVFTSLIQDVGPVTTRIDYPDLKSCEQARINKIMATGDRMIHAHCEQKAK